MVGGAKPQKSKRDWSTPSATTNVNRKQESFNKGQIAHVSKNAFTIGVGRAVGLSRVPDAELSNSPELIADRLIDLKACTKQLEEEKCSLLELKENPSTNKNTDESVSKWEAILADFRQLTMAVTASSLPEMSVLNVNVYEAAADAALLAGNLSYYLSCQTRLLHELYPNSDRQVQQSDTHLRIRAYSILYFGVSYPDKIAIAQTMRSFSSQDIRSSLIRYALGTFAARAANDSLRFLSFYRKGDLRQRTIMNPALPVMKSLALNQLVRSYLELSKSWTLYLLQMDTESDFMQLLEKEKPELVSCNDRESSLFIFRQLK